MSGFAYWFCLWSKGTGTWVCPVACARWSRSLAESSLCAQGINFINCKGMHMCNTQSKFNTQNRSSSGTTGGLYFSPPFFKAWAPELFFPRRDWNFSLKTRPQMILCSATPNARFGDVHEKCLCHTCFLERQPGLVIGLFFYQVQWAHPKICHAFTTSEPWSVSWMHPNFSKASEKWSASVNFLPVNCPTFYVSLHPWQQGSAPQRLQLQRWR